MSLLSHEDPNRVTVLTLWQDEESLKKSELGVFARAPQKVQTNLKYHLESKTIKYSRHNSFNAHNSPSKYLGFFSLHIGAIVTPEHFIYAKHYLS